MRDVVRADRVAGRVRRLRPELRTFRDERGRELFDVEDGLFADPETPAPPRFLGTLRQPAPRPRRPLPRAGRARAGAARAARRLDRHADRRRLLRAFWQLVEDSGTATLTIDRFTPHPDDPVDTARAIIGEGERLIAFVAPEATPSVRFEPAL